MVSLYFTLALLLPNVLAVGSVCTSGIYAVLAPLSSYPSAEAYCSSRYPVSPVTVTSTATASTSVITSTSVVPPVKKKRNTSKTSTKTSSTTLKTSTSTQNAQASLFSVLQSEAASIISTLCSCIESPVTIKTTVTPTPTTTTTTTTTTSTLQPYATCSNPEGPFFDDDDNNFSCNDVGPNGNPCGCAYRKQTGSGVCEASYNPNQGCSTDADCSGGALCLGHSSVGGYNYFCANTAGCSDAVAH